MIPIEKTDPGTFFNPLVTLIPAEREKGYGEGYGLSREGSWSVCL
jgi:hypothetical protein